MRPGDARQIKDSNIMLEDKKPANVAHRFPLGHERFGGRQKRTAAQARALAEEMGVDPLKFLMEVIRGDAITQTVIDENGKKKKTPVQITPEMRIDAAKHVSRFMYPTLSAQAVRADIAVEVDAQVQAAALLPTAELLKNPKFAEVLGEICLISARQGSNDAPRAALPPGAIDAMYK
jgi:hypothetical protein